MHEENIQANDVKRLIIVLVFLLLAGHEVDASSMDGAFENLASEYISDLTNLSPVVATLIGDHSADGQLDQVDDTARNETRELLGEYLTAHLSRLRHHDYFAVLAYLATRKGSG